MINVGILGFAHGHYSGFCGKWANNPEIYGVRVICGWDRDIQRRENGCRTLGIEQSGSSEELLKREDIDAVVITSETAFHAELCIAAAKAGKDIILYKPMALTLKQADDIVAAVEESGVRFTMGWQMRCDKVNLQVKNLIDSGDMGKIYHFRRRHSLGMHLDENFGNTWHANAQLNRDIFADDAAHPADLLNFLFGVPETVMCEMSTLHTPRVKNDLGVALFAYSSGMIAEVSFCASCSAAQIAAEGYFEKGALQQYGGDGPSLRLPHNMPSLKWFIEGETDWRASEIPLPNSQWERICDQSKPLAEFLRGEREAICTARQGRDSLRMVLACYLSYQSGERVSLNDERLYNV